MNDLPAETRVPGKRGRAKSKEGGSHGNRPSEIVGGYIEDTERGLVEGGKGSVEEVGIEAKRN